jgi:hypothetical protein
MSFLKKLAERAKQVAEEQAQAAATALGELSVSQEQRDARYDICKSCEHFVSMTTTCTKCGCFMAAKTHLSSVECPVGKWGKVIAIKKVD